MAVFINISAYKFVPLDELAARRAHLGQVAKDLALKGTVLLAPEGINVFFAGSRTAVDAFLTVLRQLPGCADLAPKESSSATQPFGHMRVKIKREIISFGIEGIDPARRPSPKITPAELKEWLDAGRPLTLLDTRNDYEIDAGTFNGAVRPGIRRFRDFPAAVRGLPVTLKDQPIVMFCTGGIRCEKAGPYMQREGFREVYQLDGGILKYLEACGGAHYNGTCYVFDERTTLDADLKPGADRAESQVATE